MTDLKASKDTLVASLFELSKAAQEAANATVNFYKAVEETGASGTVDPAITTLTSSLLASLATTLQQFTTNATKPPPKPRSRKRAHPENEETVKVTSEVTESAPVAPAAPPVDKSSISSDSSTTMNTTTTANTEAKPAPKARKPRAKKVVVAEVATEETPSSPPTSDEKPVAENEAEPEAKPKKKRVKRERDPNEPKKPLTIFFKYSIALREKLRQERQKQGLPNLSAIEVNDFITKEWEAVEPLVKAQMQKEYADEMKGYHVRKEEYVATKAATETAEAAAAAATENNPEYDVIVQEPGEEPRVETDVAKELPDSTVATDIEEVEVPTKEKKTKEKAKEKKKKTEKTEKKKKAEKSEKKKKTEK